MRNVTAQDGYTKPTGSAGAKIVRGYAPEHVQRAFTLLGCTTYRRGDLAILLGISVFHSSHHALGFDQCIKEQPNGS
jgi:hypothetical protein